MNDDLSLFGEGTPSDHPQRAAEPITQWQVDLLRKALDARGLQTMEDRQQAIEDAAGRPVQSLRALTHDEAMTVLTKLRQGSQTTGRSQWDERDEDTWIDRL